ncbi:MAG: DUF4974 domain-containing protein [Muribaculaceae bacterium]
MDKYDLILDIIEHPEKYTSEQLAEIMSEPETREIYNLLCKTESAIKGSDEPDVNSEWEKFSNSRLVRSRRVFSWFGSRAASIAAIVGTSIAAVAAGIAVTVSVIDHKSEPIAENTAVAPSAAVVSTDAIATKCDTVNVNLTPVMFENEPLEKIMNEVAKAYRVEVKFEDVNVASLHLYYKFDPSLTLNEVIEQLNTFEQINIRRNGKTLTID